MLRPLRGRHYARYRPSGTRDLFGDLRKRLKSMMRGLRRGAATSSWAVLFRQIAQGVVVDHVRVVGDDVGHDVVIFPEKLAELPCDKWPPWSRFMPGPYRPVRKTIYARSWRKTPEWG
jgi:hypothetical protein